MATSYLEVYNRFLENVTDYFVFSLSDEDTCNYCHGLLLNALANTKSMDHDLSNIDEENFQFSETLTNNEIAYLAYAMVAEWISPQLNNTTLTRQYIGTKDEKFYAQPNQIKQLRELRDDSIARVQKMRRNWGYEHDEYLNT